MTIVDQTRSIVALRKRLAETEKQRHRTMLETVIAHLDAEVAGSLDALMATLVPDPVYHFWGNGGDYGPKGADAISSYYAQLVADRRGVLEFDIDRIVVDDDTVVTEGWYHAINKGAVAAAQGFAVDDSDSDYLVTRRIVLFWPFNEAGEMLGEDGYGSMDPTAVRKLDGAELPEAYRRLFTPA